MEHKGPLPCLQEPATGPCPERDEFSLHPPTLFPKYPLQYYPPTYSYGNSLLWWEYYHNVSDNKACSTAHAPVCAEYSWRIIDITSPFASNKPNAIMKFPINMMSFFFYFVGEGSMAWCCGWEAGGVKLLKCAKMHRYMTSREWWDYGNAEYNRDRLQQTIH